MSIRSTLSRGCREGGLLLGRGRWLAALCFVFTASAAEIRSARFSTKPEYLFVNQPFELQFEVEVLAGCEIEGLQIQNFVGGSEFLKVGELQPLPKIQRNVGGETLDVLRFKAEACGHQAIEQTFRARLQCQIVERRSSGFFSFSQSHAVQFEIEPFRLVVQTLPEAGRPAHFSGAVGLFTLKGMLSKDVARPGDILTLTLEISGDGNLNDATMPVPRQADGFKYYPMKEILREKVRRRSEQIFIPQSTNATQIGDVRFCFFNPVTRRYEEATTGPFRITFSTTVSEPATNAVRIIRTDVGNGAADRAVSGITIEQVDQGLRPFLPLLTVGLSGLVACFVFFQLLGTHTRWGIVLALLLFLGGSGIGYRMKLHVPPATQQLKVRTEACFAPSQTAKALFVLEAGTVVIPLETAGAWVRVDSAGQRGWIPSSALEARHNAQR